MQNNKKMPIMPVIYTDALPSKNSPWPIAAKFVVAAGIAYMVGASALTRNNEQVADIPPATPALLNEPATPAASTGALPGKTSLPSPESQAAPVSTPL